MTPTTRPGDLTGQLTAARFAGSVEVELCRDGKSQTRWMMWVTRLGKRTRRRDFATPFLDHGRRTAESWYGDPIGGWRVPGNEAAPSRIAPGRATASGRQEVAASAR
jgi:hypothetical protein